MNATARGVGLRRWWRAALLAAVMLGSSVSPGWGQVCHSKEVGAILPLRLIVMGEPQENFVDQRRRLQGVIASLAIEAE